LLLERFAFGWNRFGSFSVAGCPFSLIDPILVFLERRRFAAKPPIMRVGFPWISLDSLVRIETFQWVTRIKAETFFPTAFVVAKGPSKRLAHDLAREREDCSWHKLNSVSDFLQDIAAQAIPAWPPPSKGNSL
jgi:hypothetical protein